MSLESKYLKYKEKYLNIKNQINQIEQIGAGPDFIKAVRANDLALVRKKLTEKHGYNSPHTSHPNQIDSVSGKTAVDIAKELGFSEMVDLLQSFGGVSRIPKSLVDNTTPGNRYAMIIVDPQNDFCKKIEKERFYGDAEPYIVDGTLAVKDSNSIFVHINNLVDFLDDKSSNYPDIIISKDWHPIWHMSFASNYENKKPFTQIDLKQDNHEFKQMLWPNHCIQDSIGAKITPQLKHIPHAKIILKGKDANNRVDSYSAFGDEYHGQYEKTELEYYIKMKKIQKLIVVGLATDYCVGSTAIDAKHYFPEMEVILIEDCMRGVDPTTTEAKIKLMREKGCTIYKTVEECKRNLV